VGRIGGKAPNPQEWNIGGDLQTLIALKQKNSQSFQFLIGGKAPNSHSSQKTSQSFQLLI